MRVLALLAVCTAVAHADPVDPVARRAGEEANLEPVTPRRGLVGGASLGPSFTTGETTGTGGALHLRLGHVASPTTVILFELGGATMFKRIDQSSGRITDSVSHFVAGVQHWFAGSLSVRLGGGIGAFQCTMCLDDSTPGSGDRTTFVRPGVAGTLAVVVDVVRARSVVVSVEGVSVLQVGRGGVLSNNSLNVGLSFD